MLSTAVALISLFSIDVIMREFGVKGQGAVCRRRGGTNSHTQLFTLSEALLLSDCKVLPTNTTAGI